MVPSFHGSWKGSKIFGWKETIMEQEFVLECIRCDATVVVVAEEEPFAEEVVCGTCLEEELRNH